MAQAIFEVIAGIVPGTADAKHTRRYGTKTGDDFSYQEMLEEWHKALAYAEYLQLLSANGREVNWVQITFLWP